MTTASAVAYSALLVLLAGFVVMLVGFIGSDVSRAWPEAKRLRTAGFIGVGIMLLAIVMWIVSIWMQVR